MKKKKKKKSVVSDVHLQSERNENSDVVVEAQDEQVDVNSKCKLCNRNI